MKTGSCVADQSALAAAEVPDPSPSVADPFHKPHYPSPPAVLMLSPDFCTSPSAHGTPPPAPCSSGTACHFSAAVLLLFSRSHNSSAAAQCLFRVDLVLASQAPVPSQAVAGFSHPVGGGQALQSAAFF